jgi:hypothetical protein
MPPATKRLRMGLARVGAAAELIPATPSQPEVYPHANVCRLLTCGASHASYKTLFYSYTAAHVCAPSVCRLYSLRHSARQAQGQVGRPLCLPPLVEVGPSPSALPKRKFG